MRSRRSSATLSILAAIVMSGCLASAASETTEDSPITACEATAPVGPLASSSSLGIAGHDEGSTPGAAESYKGKLVAISELAATRSVILSYRLPVFEAEGWKLFAAILDAGAPGIVVMRPEDDADTEWIQSKRILQDTLGDRFSRLTFIKQPNAPHETESGKQTTEDHTVWARDWAPLMTRTATGEKVFVEFNYFSGRTVDDSAPARIAEHFKSKRISLPLYNEGGNFMVDERSNCVMTDRIIVENKRQPIATDKVYTEAEIKEVFASYLGCKTTTIMPRYIDRTGHVDMFAKFLPGNRVLVSEILDETIKFIGGEIDRNQRRRDQNYLNERASQFASLGYTVVRTPQPNPFFSTFGSGGTSIMWSYTNSLIVNKTAIVPSFSLSGNNDESLRLMYEQRARASYESSGLRVVFVPAETIVKMRGIIHCVSMQVPC
jgi:agmatine/peptidylarginine deiminase